MTRLTRLLLFALLLHTLLVLLYGLICLLLIRKNRREALLRCLVMLAAPFVGMVYFGLGALWRRLFFHAPVDLDDVVFAKTRKKTVLKANEEEMDFVPIEEAIMVTDRESTRNLLLEIAKYDVEQSLSSIRQALNVDDSELSHYAAAVMQTEIDAFRVGAQRMLQLIRKLEDEVGAAEATKAPDQQKLAETVRTEVDVCHELFSDVSRMLEQKVISPAEEAQYTELLEELAALLEKRDVLQAYEIEAVILLKIGSGDYAAAEDWCARSEARYPTALSTYTCRLRLYYTTGEHEKFFEWMEKTKHSGIPLDHETLEMIRVFL